MIATEGTGSAADDPRVELARLRREYDELLNSDVALWLKQVRTDPGFSRDHESSLSWRITRPLRLARAFQLRAHEDGLGAALGQAATVVKRSVQRR